MEEIRHISIDSLYCIGLSYKNADETFRGRYSLTSTQINLLLEDYKKEGVKSVMVVSTCNRTEVYGLVQHPFLLIKQFMKHTEGDIDVFENVAYVYKNNDAISHMFNVATGLDSQILGDFEIVAQLKHSFNLSKKQGLVDPFLERLYNNAIQASKRVKNETCLSSGTTSVAFAAVQYILQNVEDPLNKNILLFGTGKIGRNVCENLVKQIGDKKITLINRTQEKSKDIAEKLHISFVPYKNLSKELLNTDILIVATGASEPTILKETLPNKRELLILDLSIPKNVHEDVQTLEKVKVLHVDYLSKVTDKTLERRRAAIPESQKIIQEVKAGFDQWVDERKFAPVILALKEKLSSMKDAEIDFQNKKNKNLNIKHIDVFADRFIQKITTHFANHLKQNQDDSNESLRVFKSVFQLKDKQN